MHWMKRHRYIALVLASVMAGANGLAAADSATPDDIAQLKAMIASQQKQLDSLQKTLADQQKLLDRAISQTASQTASARPQRLGEVASLTPIIPPVTVAQLPAPAAGNPCDTGPDMNAVPPFIRLGNVCVVPIGFMDLTSVWRDKNAGSSLGSNFGSLPYNNTAAAKLSEFRFTPQNSRVGFRIDGNFKGAHVTGYNEFDFLSSATPGSSGVTNGAFVPRLRLFWVDVRKGKLEFLAGQSWSMLTPNRKGISALPGDVFYSQVIDVNYMAGLTWTRQPGVRVLYHPNAKVTMGLSFENPDQYIGGSAGGSSIVLPATLGAVAGAQLDNTSGGVLSTPNVHPDIIAKIAFDPNARVHIEIAGIERTFKIWNSVTNQYFTKAGGGGSLNANVELVKNLRLVTNNYWSDGGGRYLFGQVPDVIVRADGSLSAIHAGSTVDGVEAVVKNWLLYTYYGGIYAGRNTALDANGRTYIGYGYPGSANSQNRNIQEVTFGFNETLWKNPRYGALNFMGQYEYLLRHPWAVTAGAPKGTHDNTVYFNLRYTLPGDMPKF